MTPRKILSRALVLAALTALAGAAVASASPLSHGQGKKQIVGRVASLSATGFTVNGRVLSATGAQLAGLAEGQCVEVRSRLGQGTLNVVRIKREDRCAPLAATTTSSSATSMTAPAGSDDPAQHDVADDHSVDPTQPVAVGTVGADDAPGHDAGDDHGRHGNRG